MNTFPKGNKCSIVWPLVFIVSLYILLWFISLPQVFIVVLSAPVSITCTRFPPIITDMAQLSTIPNKDPHPNQKERLMDAYNRLIEEVSVDFTIQEIKDMQTATNTMLQQVVDRVNARGVFSVARIIPTGSMVDKTALWKGDKEREEHSLEFDYLAVLTNTIEYYCRGEDPRVLYSRIKEESVFEEKRDCVGCELVNAPEELDRMGKCHNNGRIRMMDLRFIFNERFIIEINRSLVSSCDCFTVTFDPPDCAYAIRFHSALDGGRHGCDRCTIDTPTGVLSVNTSLPISQRMCGSLILLWTSKAKSLEAPEFITSGIQSRKQINSLTVHIDFLPVIESIKPAKTEGGSMHKYLKLSQSEGRSIHESLKPTPSEGESMHDYFIVPKHCNVSRMCDGWRKSWCMAEMREFIEHMSENHRKCYQIIKWHIKIGFLGRVSDYHVKTVVLHHSQSCSKPTNDVIDCLREILTELLLAYESGELKQFKEPRINLLRESGNAWLEFNVQKRQTRLLIKMLEFSHDGNNLDTFIEYLPKDKLLRVVAARQEPQETSTDETGHVCAVSTFAN